MDIEGKTVLITGASSGIGEALAKELSRHGAHLILASRRTGELERVRASCVSPERHHVCPLDLAETGQLEARMQEIIRKFGPIDILVNNAGIAQRSLAEETTLAVEQRIMAVNYFACLITAKAVIPGMRERGDGQIVIISSLVGKIATPYRSSYAASKHALHGYFDAVRAELYGSGIHVTLVCPGFVRTQISANALTGDGQHWNTMDRNQARGLPAERCARAIVRAMKRNSPELIIAGVERLAVTLNRLFPSLYRRLIRRLGAPRRR